MLSVADIPLAGLHFTGIIGVVFTARLLEKAKHPLKAPDKGSMIRTIHESAICRAYYEFRINGHIIFAFETENASFEYEY